MTHLILTSDFPSTPIDAVAERIRHVAPTPRVAWIPPFTAIGRPRFAAAEAAFRSIGVSSLEDCDIDEERSERQLASLTDYDVVYLTGGDPLGFWGNLRRAGLVDRLRAVLDAGRLVVAASGGSMQFTPNTSLVRLLSTSVETVIAERDEYDAIGIVPCEILPHLNRLDEPFLEKVRRYSHALPHDIVALEDGAALMQGPGSGEASIRFAGNVVRFRSGVQTSVSPAA